MLKKKPPQINAIICQAPAKQIMPASTGLHLETGIDWTGRGDRHHCKPRAIRASVASLEIGYVAYKLSKSIICWHCQYAPHKSDHSSSMAMLWPARLAVPLAGFFTQARMQCVAKAMPPARASIILRRLALPFIPKPGPPIGTDLLVVTPAAWQHGELH